MSDLKLHNFSFKLKNELQKSPQWKSIQSIYKLLNDKNRLCWLSGGAVRDLLISKEPQDFDLTTDATDEEIINLFPQAILIGRQFGVYKIPLNNEIFDLTIFREEDGYIDGRRPTRIVTSSPEKDALRRDFTINALYWDIKNETLIDYVNGLDDLEKKFIRCVGLPGKRFEEDHLRILRMIRFAYQLNFSVDKVSYQEGFNKAESLTSISGERILSEILKIKNNYSRIEFLSDDLFINIMKHNNFIFKDITEKINLLKRSSFETNYTALVQILFLMGINLENIKLIQDRFCISNDIYKYLLKCNEVHKNLNQESNYIDFIIMIDISDDYFQIIKYFFSLNIIKKTAFNEILDAKNKFFQKKITAKDIISFVDHKKISEILRKARVWQIKNQVTEIEEIISYIKSNYSEKT